MIKSTDLHVGMKLSMGGSTLEVAEIKHDKRRTIAVCLNEKGKRVQHTVSELYYGNAKVIGQQPKAKPAAQRKPKPQKMRITIGKKLGVSITMVPRADGMLTTYRGKDGRVYSSWQKTR